MRNSDQQDGSSSRADFVSMLWGDGQRGGQLQSIPDIGGSISNRFLPICLIAAIACESDLLFFCSASVPGDASLIDLQVLEIYKRSQLPTIYQLACEECGGEV